MLKNCLKSRNNIPENGGKTHGPDGRSLCDFEDDSRCPVNQHTLMQTLCRLSSVHYAVSSLLRENLK